LKTKIVEPVALDRAPIGCFKAVLERVSALHFRALQQGATSSLFKGVFGIAVAVVVVV
jgi:hypothetical protein